MKCECEFRTRLVGDGCQVCNPEKALEIAHERIAELEKALRLIAEHKGKALLGDGRYDEGANAAFNQMADIAASVLMESKS